MIKKMNNKGLATFGIIVFVILGLIGIYLVLSLPIPAFASIRSLINYISILVVFIVFQIALIYGYYRLGKLAKIGFYIYKKKIQLWTLNVKQFLLTRS